MSERELLDKLGKLIKYKDGKGYISGIDIMNLNLDIATYCYILEVLNRNDITIIRNKIIENKEVLNKVLECQKSESLELQNEIIEEFMYYIFLYASYFAKRYHIPVQELISYGCEAVIYAIGSYKPNHDKIFTIYCNNYIKKFLEEAVIDITKKKIDDDKGNDENFYEFIIERGIYFPLLTEELRYEINNYLINNPISLDSDEFLRNESNHPLDSSIEQADDRCFVSDILNDLSSTERRLLELRFGLNGQSACTYDKISEIQGTSKYVTGNTMQRIFRKIRIFDKDRY